MSKIWQALKDAELRREPAAGAEITSSGQHLTDDQQAALYALLAHGSVSAAAASCGISPNALEGWLREPDFVAAYHAASRAARTRR